MYSKGGCLLVLVLVVVCWTYADARSSVVFNELVEYRAQEDAIYVPGSVKRNEQLCDLCEEFAAKATYFIGENKTHDEILATLHQACSKLGAYREQCIILVDYYASLFFEMFSTSSPEEFCTRVGLCVAKLSIASAKTDETCNMCHQAVVEILIKLRDPDTQLDIIKLLLEQCKKLDAYAHKCKSLVFQYGPLILAQSEKFLETTDVCTVIGACKLSQLEAVNRESGTQGLVTEA